MSHPHDLPLALAVHVVTVSTSRSAGEDRSGPLLRELAVAAGHSIAGHAIVPDDPEAIGVELDRALDTPGLDVVILTGGTGVSARDCTPLVVTPRLDRVIPGFGELFRYLSFQEVGSKSMVSGALAGIAKNKLVFALPGSTGACRLAMEKLILPELPHLAGELRKESPLPRKSGELVRPVVRSRTTADAVPPYLQPRAPEALPPAAIAEPPRRGIDVVAMSTETPEPSSGNPGWQAALVALGGKLVPAHSMAIPDALAAIPAAMDVLNSANARMKLVAEDGRSWLCFGYPDLLRPGSKVLAVREALPVAEVVALHRWPARVGLCCEGESLLPTVEASVAEESEARTSRACDEDGQLFAVDTTAVWLRQRRYVRKWDGKRIGPEDNVGPAIGSLLLAWSQR